MKFMHQNQLIVKFIKSGLYTDVQIQNFQTLQILLRIRSIGQNNCFIHMVQNQQDIQALLKLALDGTTSIKKKSIYLLDQFSRSSIEAQKYVYTNQSFLKEIISLVTSNELGDEQLIAIALICCKRLLNYVQFMQDHGKCNDNNNCNEQICLSYKFAVLLFDKLKKNYDLETIHYYAINCIEQFIKAKESRLLFLINHADFYMLIDYFHKINKQLIRDKLLDIFILVSYLEDEIIENLFSAPEIISLIFEYAINQNIDYKMVYKASFFISNICASSRIFIQELLKIDKFEKLIFQYQKLDSSGTLMNFLMIIGNLLQQRGGGGGGGDDESNNIDHLYNLYPAVLKISCEKCNQVLTCLNFEKTKQWDNEIFINGNLKIISKILKKNQNPQTDYKYLQDLMAQIAGKSSCDENRELAIQICLRHLNYNFENQQNQVDSQKKYDIQGYQL